jgi:phage terminase Nu1 subunit (DNA packaging protein)
MVPSRVRVKKNEKKNPARKPKPSPIVDPLIATLAQIADEHSVEKRTFNLWVKDHGCPREDRGLYNRKKVNLWKEARRQGELLEARAGGEDEKQSRARLIRGQADMVEHKLKQLRAEFIKISDAVFILSNAAVKANQEFDEIPKSAAVTVVNMETIEEIENHLREQINGAKIRVAELGEQAEVFAKRYSTDLALAEIPDAEGDTDDQPVVGKGTHAALRSKRAKRRVEKHAAAKVHP